MASSRINDPRRLDVGAFAAAGAELAGEWPIGGFSRLATAMLPPTAEAPPVRWRLLGERRPLAGAGVQAALGLEAQTVVELECQRCLQAMSWPIRLERRLFFVEGEDAAAALDAESDDDVLALASTVDAHALIEDELLLALPIVPRHPACDAPVPLSQGDATRASAGEQAESEHPFAALAALKRGPRPN